jgi:hypothetical protein
VHILGRPRQAAIFSHSSKTRKYPWLPKACDRFSLRMRSQAPRVLCGSDPRGRGGA